MIDNDNNEFHALPVVCAGVLGGGVVTVMALLGLGWLLGLLLGLVLLKVQVIKK